jgi:hypothetical protein
MNKERRKQIEAARKLIEQALTILDEAKEELITARDGEQDYRDNMPDSFADGEKGDRADEVVAQLDDAIGQIEEMMEGTIYDCLEEASQ